MKTIVQQHVLNQLLHTFISGARVATKGAVAMLYNNAFQCKQLSEGKFNSFDHVALQVRFSCCAVGDINTGIHFDKRKISLGTFKHIGK